MQPDPHLALAIQAGYSAVIRTSGASSTLHFVPVGLEAIVSPVPALDIGASFFLDGHVGGSDDATPNVGYFDLRSLMFWFRIHG